MWDRMLVAKGTVLGLTARRAGKGSGAGLAVNVCPWKSAEWLLGLDIPELSVFLHDA